MSDDMDARQITLNYEGGSLEMSVGNAKSIFGEDFPDLNPDPTDLEVSVKSHSRVRVIGGDSKTISAYSYTYKQWPTSLCSGAGAGTVIYMSWTGSDGQFTGRVSGPMAEAAQYFSDNATKTLVFRTKRGTEYGPFAQKEE